MLGVFGAYIFDIIAVLGIKLVIVIMIIGYEKVSRILLKTGRVKGAFLW
jgi:hypothetical protein